MTCLFDSLLFGVCCAPQIIKNTLNTKQKGLIGTNVIGLYGVRF